MTTAAPRARRTTRTYALAAALLLLGVLTSCGDELPTGPSAQRLFDADSSGMPQLSVDASNVASAPLDLASFSDDFAGTSLDLDRWELRSPPGRVVVDHRLAVSVAPGSAELSQLFTRLPHSFRGSTFVAEVSQFAAGGTTVGTMVAVASADETSYVIFNAFGGQLTAWYRWNGQAPVQLTGSLPLHAGNHRFLRLREAQGVVHFETSSNGAAWTLRWSVTHHFPDLDQLHGIIGVASWGTPPANPTPAHFENVNTLVPASPRALTVSGAGPLALQLAWQDRSVNESAFEVERRVAGSGSFQPVTSLPAGTNSWLDTGLPGAGSYEYRVRALNAAGPSAFSAPASGTAEEHSPPPPPPPPTAPALGTFADDFAGTILDLDRWEARVTDYTIPGSGSPAPPGTVVLDDHLQVRTTPGQNEHISVRTRLPHSFPGQSFAAEISQFAGGGPTIETFVAVISADHDEFVILSAHDGLLTAWYKWSAEHAWEQLPGSLTLDPVMHRFLRLREDAGFVYYETSATGETWTAEWYVQQGFSDPHGLYGEIGVGSWGTPPTNPTPAHFENVNTLVPASPRALTVSGAGPLALQLAWQDRSVNESAFEVERRVAGSGNFQLVTSLPSGTTSWLDSGLPGAGSYEYRVRALNDAGPSAFSAPAAGSADDHDPSPPPPPPPPTAPALGSFSDDFAGTTLDLERWELRALPGRVTVDHRLAVSVAPGSAELSQLFTRLPRSFRESTFVAEVSQFAAGGATVGTMVAVSTADESSYVIFNAFAGQLTAWHRWNGQAPVQLSGSLPLHAGNHRFLRLREAQGTVHFETSSNGASWTLRWSVGHHFPDLDQLHGIIGVASWGTPPASPIPAHFENVNTLVPASPRALTVSGAGPLALQLAWQDRSVNESAFEVERRVAGSGTFQPVTSLPAGTTSWLDSGLPGAGSYEYRVRALNAAGPSAFSAPASGTAEDHAPPPPPPPPPPPTAPALASFSDDFAGTTLDLDRWELRALPGRVSVDHRLMVSVAPGSAELSQLFTRLPHSFRGSTFVTEVSQFAAGGGTIGTMVAVSTADESSYVIFNAFGGQLTAWHRWNGQAPVQLSGSLPLHAGNHRFLRLREAQGTVHFETSSNGASWTLRWSVGHHFPDLDQLHGIIGVASWGTPPANPIPAHFANVNP